MNRARVTVVLVTACATALFAVAGAFAASPQAIYRDYADNGKLDGNYSKADLKRALNSAVVQAYSHGQNQGLKPAIKTKINQSTGQGVASAPPVKKSGGLPFTGFDLGLITVGALSLLLFGAALRRFARQKA